MKKLILTILILLWSLPGWGATIYVDGSSVDCSGDYSITNRSCTGSDGDSYAEIDDAILNSNGGDDIIIRAGTYNDSDGNGYPQQTIAKQLDISTYQNEAVIWVIHNAERGIYFNGAGADGVTINVKIALKAYNKDNKGNLQISDFSNIANKDITFPINYVTPNAPTMVLIIIPD